MYESSFPTDLYNPGQVLACLGFLELAGHLLGDVEGRFHWNGDTSPTFSLRACQSNESPVRAVLEFLAQSTLYEIQPTDNTPLSPSSKPDRMTYPVRLHAPGRPDFDMSHWADTSSRDSFKLYSGNRSAFKIATGMLSAYQSQWKAHRDALLKTPLHVLMPIGGSFNFDPRGAWTAIDAGYSLNDQGHDISSSPLTELLAACGLEFTRPIISKRHVTYAVWKEWLPPVLARVAFQKRLTGLDYRVFSYELALSGKNKVITFAQEETINVS